MSQLIENSVILSCITPTAGVAGTSAINGSIIDLSSAAGALFLVRMGVITAGAATSIKIQHGAASDLSDAADVLGTSQTIADDDDGEIFYVDFSRPTKRYARLVVSRATQNAVVASAEVIVYGAAVAPTAQPAGTNGETHVAKQSGTA
jgi:hypothetical protein